MKRLLLMTATLLLCMSWLSLSELSAQTSRVIRGQVLEDSSGEPLPGVSILERGTTNGTVTDLDGNFVLTLTSEEPILRLSFIGFKTQELVIEGDEDLKITMESDLGSLEEVVVVGYGERQKETITGAISNVTSRDIEKVPSATVSGALAGKMAGLSFRQPDGRPGAGAWLQIRNMGTPLFVIDGIQKDEGQFNNLAPTDIESITILKDAAAAVYGSRAANGVVVVKTKQGTRGENPTININGYYGWQNWSRFPEGVDAYEWMLGKADADINQFGSTNITAEELAKWNAGTEYGYRSFDWNDFIIQGNAPQSNFNASVSGGSEKTNYYISATRFDQKAVFSDEFEFSRTNIQSNVTTDITDKLTVGVQINGRIEERNNPGVPGGDDYWQPRFALFRNRPTERPYANDNPDYPANISNIETNWALLNYDRTGFYTNKWQVIQTNFNADYEILPGLNAKGMYSYYLADNMQNTFEYTYDVYGYNPETDEYFRSGGNDNPYRGRGQEKIMENVWQLSLNYDKTFNEKHHVSALFLNERIQRTRLYNFVHSVPTNNYLDIIKFADVDTYNDERQEEARIGYVGRVNYDYAGKYLLELAGRADASWKFSPDNRWGFFPSVSAGWRISEEGFMDNLTSRLNMDELKIRASYGQLGDDNINMGIPSNDSRFITPFDYMSGYIYGVSTVIVDGQNIPGSANTGQPVDNLSWFVSNMTDVGVDFSFASGKITGQADYFYRKRTGLRGVRNDVFLPLELGYGLTDENLNTDAHSGAELAVNWNGKAGDVVFRIGGNVSYARGKFLESYNPTFSSSWDQYRNSREDRYNSIFWGYETIGQFTSFEEINNYPVNVDGQGNKTLLPGDLIYKDVNNDGKIDSYDERPVGYQSGGQPIVNFGLNFNFAYKGFDLTADFSGGGMYSYNQNWEMRWPYQNGGNLLAAMYDDRYHREDILDINSPWVPGKNPPLRFNTGGHSNYNKNSTWWLTNVKYLRMRTLELGYTLPERMLNKWKMQTARVFVSTYNLFALDNVHQLGIDPEVAEENGLQYPQNKVVNVGFNISF
ncbi:SusC/RagA family TonB-linked outer membrane protein [Algoriphagus terrigena]|uniref:SusC/RagA family TonB-linked outer membrane protein n=1 Tax=Algoriphagus terrigena TaxID=344884 RepID=UPI0004101A80|nr:TonB-dependent receptor [Algoriphagus terrigena]